MLLDWQLRDDQVVEGPKDGSAWFILYIPAGGGHLRDRDLGGTSGRADMRDA